MEFVEALLYHKIMDSDFTNMYTVKKPTGGGGQSYIQAAGFEQWELVRMFQYAAATPTNEYWDAANTLPRFSYTIVAQEIGTNAAANLEFAPRTGRKDYRICRQNLKYRHPAWSPASGFPAPNKNAQGTYIAVHNYPGIIDHLYIFVVCTVSDAGEQRYYASFVNGNTLPQQWPSHVGLERIFQGASNKQGIIFFDNDFLRFQNDRNAPFVLGSAVDVQIGEHNLPADTDQSAVDAVEYASQTIDMNINLSEVVFDEKYPPTPVKRNSRRTPIRRILINVDYIQRYRNNKAVGDAGEALVMEMEKRRLEELGRKDLAEQVRHVSKDVGDGLGYDIESFDLINGRFEKIYIEVKATTGGVSKPFEISASEVEASRNLQDRYYLYRLFALRPNSTRVFFYKVIGDIETQFRLTALSYSAVIK
jgi:hypothetical protein